MSETDLWPPYPYDIAAARFAELDAWYSGDTETLQKIYSGGATEATHLVAGRPFKGGVLGTLSKMWWGAPVVPDEKRTKMHLPLAADLCSLSADLLFGEAPQIVFRRPEDAVAAVTGANAPKQKWKHPAQDRLDKIMASDETHAELLLGGEYAAALGGTYWAAAWDERVADHVFPKAYAADCAIPRFLLGHLIECTLWSEYRDGNEVYRLLEVHKPGSIEYTLYKGTDRTLGRPAPVTDRTETAYLADLRKPADLAVPVEEYSETISVGTGTQKLSVVYMRNARPVRDWRKMGELANLGRSDLDGLQDPLDKVDQVWSSLLRDIELGAGRMTVPESWLTQGTRGDGASFDPDRTYYSGVNMLGTQASPEQAVASQFLIRVDEHLSTIDALKREIASAIGYSPTHLGLKDVRGTKTATEVDADLSDSERTRDKKAMYAKPALAKFAVMALEIDATVFGSGVKPSDLAELPDVEFAPVSQADPEKTARTAQLLDAARAASRREIIRVVHPDWDPEEVDAEFEAIQAEQAASMPTVPDPTQFKGDEQPDDEPDKPEE